MPIDLTGDVVVAPPVIPAVRTAPPAPGSVTVLPVVGPTGPQGSPGTPGGSYFVHTQSSPAATWIIDHNLAKKVHVSIFNSTGTVIYADIDHGTTNQTTITFPGPVTGSAVVS